MQYRLAAICMMATALTALPALAQTNSTMSPSSPAPQATSVVPDKQAVTTAQEFVTQAAIGGMLEIQSSQIALKKSQDRDIQQFAHRMIQDHTKADDRLKSLAKGETVPSSLDQQHKDMLNTLQQANGSDFADQFKQMQVAAHEQAIDLFQNYAQNGDNAQLKQFAQQTLPTLKDHLQMAQAITVASSGSSSATQQAATTSTSATSAAVASTAAGTTTSDGKTYLTEETPDTWRASKVIGVGVFNEQNEKIGNINEVLFHKDGTVEGVVIGVGGFLGIGERNVAVPYNDLQWSMTPPDQQNARGNDNLGNPSATPATTGTGLGTAPNATGAPTSVTPMGSPSRITTASNQPAAYPDHAILPNASKDQLDKAPQFQYGSSPR